MLDRSARTVVTRSLPFEEVEHILSAIGRPSCEKSMLGVLQYASASHRNKPGVTFLGDSLPFVHSASF